MSATATLRAVDRLLEPSAGSMSLELARWLVGLRADEATEARVAELSAKNTAGTISPDELDELDAIIDAADLVGILQSKARRVLASTNGH